MQKIGIRRRLVFSAGHRVYGHEGGCAMLHGHNFTVWLNVVAKEGHEPQDKLGRVVDFSEVKRTVGGWINEHWDHGFIVWHQDEEAKYALRQVVGQRVFQLPFNPTAENLARYLVETVGPEVLPGFVELTAVDLYETENGVGVFHSRR